VSWVMRRVGTPEMVPYSTSLSVDRFCCTNVERLYNVAA
jgi:hypothetical protein